MATKCQLGGASVVHGHLLFVRNTSVTRRSGLRRCRVGGRCTTQLAQHTVSCTHTVLLYVSYAHAVCLFSCALSCALGWRAWWLFCAEASSSSVNRNLKWHIGSSWLSWLSHACKSRPPPAAPAHTNYATTQATNRGNLAGRYRSHRLFLAGGAPLPPPPPILAATAAAAAIAAAAASDCAAATAAGGAAGGAGAEPPWVIHAGRFEMPRDRSGPLAAAGAGARAAAGAGAGVGAGGARPSAICSWVAASNAAGAGAAGTGGGAGTLPSAA